MLSTLPFIRAQHAALDEVGLVLLASLIHLHWHVQDLLADGDAAFGYALDAACLAKKPEEAANRPNRHPRCKRQIFDGGDPTDTQCTHDIDDVLLCGWGVHPDALIRRCGRILGFGHVVVAKITSAGVK